MSVIDPVGLFVVLAAVLAVFLVRGMITATTRDGRYYYTNAIYGSTRANLTSPLSPQETGGPAFRPIGCRQASGQVSTRSFLPS